MFSMHSINVTTWHKCMNKALHYVMCLLNIEEQIKNDVKLIVSIFVLQIAIENLCCFNKK